MSLTLDHMIFGNGNGLASPFFDGVFYWLVDTKNGRKNGTGALYSYIGGLGAQLRSRQWTHPTPGERRMLCGRHFIPFDSVRRGLRVEVAWAIDGGLPRDLNEANAFLRDLKADLSKGGNVY